MDAPNLSWAETSPKIMQRECGGWLAVTPAGAVFQIGVTGATEAEVIENFEQAKRRWAEIRLSGDN